MTASQLPPESGGRTIPKRLGDYELLERLGGGPTGPIFKAKHRTSGAVVAVKVLPPELARQETVRKRFEREAALAKRLNHPSLIAAFDSGCHDDVPYLVMEYFSGQKLSDVVKDRGPLSVEEAEDYLLQAAAGLAYLHGYGVVHRNIKPHNLLVSSTGNVKIGNLLLARLEEGSLLHGDGVSLEELTRTGQVMGSADYLPPEQARDCSRVDARADIYALGCTLFYLLTGKPPYGRKSAMLTLMAHAQEPIPSLCAARPEVPAKLDRLFQQMLAKEPAERIATMQDCIDTLEAPNRVAQFARWAIPATIVLVAAAVLYLLFS